MICLCLKNHVGLCFRDYTDTESECENIILFVYGITRSKHPDQSGLIRTSIVSNHNLVFFMKTVKIKDKEFSVSIAADEIHEAVCNVAQKINKDMDGKTPLFLAILNGSFMFASDLFKQLTIQCEISFVKLSSYQGTTSTENVKTIIGLTDDIKGKTVIIVEDIVDTGYTIQDIIDNLKKFDPAEIRICTMLFKPNAYKKNINIDYVGIEIPNDFIVGYGLDYDGLGRNLADIYKIV